VEKGEGRRRKEKKKKKREWRVREALHPWD